MPQLPSERRSYADEIVERERKVNRLHSIQRYFDLLLEKHGSELISGLTTVEKLFSFAVEIVDQLEKYKSDASKT